MTHVTPFQGVRIEFCRMSFHRSPWHQSMLPDTCACVRRVIVKLGPRYDMGALLPRNEWKVAVYGTDFCVWEK